MPWQLAWALKQFSPGSEQPDQTRTEQSEPLEIDMSTNDQKARPEQKRPKDVSPTTDDEKFADEESMAPPTFQPAGAKDESERPIVNPVTGGAI